MAIMDRSMEGKRQYTTGISKGVFFGEDGKAFPWNGLISVTEKPQANAPTPVYNSLGEKYDQFGNIAEKKHSLTCYTYPEEMDEFLGIEYLEEMGYSVDERPPKKFSMAYRTELGDGLYEIHVLLNQIATFADTAKNTITNNITPTVVTMNLEGVPDPRIKTSHIILDSRLPLTASAERLLFGDRLIDGNINEFLDAEPTWVTVATNYAPIIEPDYDNMVWLGGENLLSGSLDTSVTHDTTLDVYTYGLFRLPAGAMAEGDVVTISFQGSFADPNVRFDIMNGQRQYVMSGSGITQADKNVDGVFSRTITFRNYGSNTHIFLRQHGSVSPNDTLHWIKMEFGDTRTPWTPAPEDNYVPPADQPRPANYVPGVKNGHLWDIRSSVPWRKTSVYYDEIHKALGVYSLSLDGLNASAVIALPNLLQGTPVAITAETIQDGILDSSQVSFQGRYPTVSAIYDSSKKDQDIRIEYTPTPEYLSSFLIRHGGFVGSGSILLRNIMITQSTWTGGFFDVFTNPKTKGDRYVRSTDDSISPQEYTEHQQLMLQSKSRVILSDITPNQYTLEASDSQLRVDGQTFTFKGPQATPIGDDQFTIDDEIYGEE